MVCGGVSIVCTARAELGVPIAHRLLRPHQPGAAARWRTQKEHISRVHAANYEIYGARKVWLTLNRGGIG